MIVILGVLASLVVPNLLGNKEKADRQKAISDIVALENALDMYRLDNGRYPTTEEQGLEALILNRPIWRTPATTVPVDTLNGFRQKIRGAMIISISARVRRTVDVYTLGADGQENGEGAGADIGNWNLQEFQ